MQTWGLIGLWVVLIGACIAGRSAYYNGVTDGYGAAVEPNNPGYNKARRWLRKHMYYRWPELTKLTEEDEEPDDVADIPKNPGSKA